MAAKGPEAFRSISEASAELGVAPHVLRFWETRFSFIRPMTRSGGRRFYRPQDLDVLRGVRALLHDEGYSIKGVQRLHREEGVTRLLSAGAGSKGAPEAARVDVEVAEGARPTLAAGPRRALHDVLADLERTKDRIDRLLSPPPPQS